jgi:Fe-S-cluster containining protein
MITDPRLHPSRAQLQPGEVLCQFCTAKCCRYYSLPLEQPKTRKDFDYIRWFLMHGRSAVYIEDGTWYLLVYSDCQHLLPDNRCGIYETRPQICREYTTDNCEYDDDWTYERFFETAEQVEEYVDALLPDKARRGIRGKKPPVLPVINV